MKTILNILAKLSFKDYIILILLLLSMIFYFNYKHYYKKSLNPVIVYNTDSLTIYKNKLQEIYKEKEIYIQNLKDLKDQNNLLSVEVNKLKDNPLVVTNTKLQVKIDTVKAKSDTIIKYIDNDKDTLYNLSWHVQEPKNYFNINGLTNVKSDFSMFTTQINQLTLNTNLTLDIIEKNKKISIIGKTDNPYINIINMDGVVLDPNNSKLLKKYMKKNKWNIGPTIGVGITSDMKVKPYMGLGVSYGIIRF